MNELKLRALNIKQHLYVKEMLAKGRRQSTIEKSKKYKKLEKEKAELIEQIKKEDEISRIEMKKYR